MTVRIESIEPDTGATWGGNVVKLSGEGFGSAPRVLFGGVPALIQLVDADACYVLAPQHSVGWVDVDVIAGGERCQVVDGYRFARGSLGGESDLTRLVRTLLRNLKTHVLDQTSMAVDVAYGVASESGEASIALATLPGIVVSGPDILPNRVLSTNVAHEARDEAEHAVVFRPPLTVDLVFSVAGAASQKVALLDIMNSVVNYVHNVGSISMLRDVEFPRLGHVTWPLDFAKAPRASTDVDTGIKAFSCDVRIRGFDLAGSYPNRLMPLAEAARVRLDLEEDNHA